MVLVNRYLELFVFSVVCCLLNLLLILPFAGSYANKVLLAQFFYEKKMLLLKNIS